MHAQARPGTSPSEWAASLSAPPVASSDPCLMEGGLLRHWVGTAQCMSQPVLNHHYLVLHLGGAKRVKRSGEGRVCEAEVSSGQLTVVPTGSSYSWFTQGPIEFLHLYIDPRRLDRAVSEGFDREPRGVGLKDPIGVDAPLIERLMLTLREAVVGDEALPRLYYEGLFDAVLLQVVRQATDMASCTALSRQAIAPYRLRRVQEFIAAHLADDMTLQDLADVAGLSRFHFSRAFQQTTGLSPFRYLTRERVAQAKRDLSDPKRSVAQVAVASGFGSAAQFSNTFKKSTGLSPREWRRRL